MGQPAFDISNQLLVLEIGSGIVGIWLIFYALGYKHKEMFTNLPENDFSMHEIYFVGYAFLRLIRYSFNTNSDISMRQKLEVLYERKYIEFYLRVYRSRQVTYGITVLLFAFILFAFMNDFLIFGVLVFSAGLIAWYYGNTVTSLVQERKDSMMADFCDVVSQMALLINSGMVLRDAWETISKTGDSVLYKEMQLAVVNIQNGMTQSQAINEFGNRSMLLEVKKFAASLTQGLTKGSGELTDMLTNLSREAWNEKRQMVIRQKESTGTKLLIPMLIMFLGVLIMILVPLFSGMSGGLLG
ncbi:hypothetical protein FACS1894125_5950 [Actinomycetota bacterium]|nr:hypothetical protein FACS1894125_5950 [Actinomycetota bacterium]